MSILTLLVGPAGSGKTTYSKGMLYDHGVKGESLIYVNQDSQKGEHIQIFEQAIRESKNIIVDRMNMTKGQRKHFLDKAKKNGYRTEIVVLHQAYRICLERCSKREDHETIKDEKSAKAALSTFFTKYERVEDSEADKVTRIWPEGPKPKAIWIDIDGTLSDATHRQHHVRGENKDWPAFFAEMGKDPMNHWCKEILLAMDKAGYQILICTGRPADYYNQTTGWLLKNDIHPYKYKLFMRYYKDSRQDYIIKEIMYEFEVKTQYDLLFSIDDRQQVVNKIRERGVLVLDCAGPKGEF